MNSSFSGFSTPYPRRERMFPRIEQRFFQGEHEAGIEAILKSSFEDHIDREVVIGNEGMLSKGELKIGIDHSSLENQTNRFVMELGLSKTEAENISKDVRDLAEVKINEQGKNWSKNVREAFANLMTAILIEEVKATSPPHGNPKSLTALGTYSAVAFDRTIRYDYRQTGVLAKLVSHAQTLDIENVNRLRDKMYPDRI